MNYSQINKNMSPRTPWKHIGSGGITPVIRTHGVGWWVVSFTVSRGKNPVPTERKAECTTEHICPHCQNDKLLPLLGIELQFFRMQEP